MQRFAKVGTIILSSIAALGIVAWFGISTFLDSVFEEGPTRGPSFADNQCPTFETVYPQCEIRFGNSGLSTLNSFYETFVGEGAFEISSFEVETLGRDRFTIVAQSNRGPITSNIIADRLVRLGEEREDEQVYRTHESSFCDAERIYEHVVTFQDGARVVQDLEFWTEDGSLWFRLFQNGSPTAEVVCGQ